MKRICPLRGTLCDEEKCALWVKLEKPAPRIGYIWVYEGCGLVNEKPWEMRKEAVKGEG